MFRPWLLQRQMHSVTEFLKWKKNLFSLPFSWFKEIKLFLLKLKTNGPLDRLSLLLVEALWKKVKEIQSSPACNKF